MGTKPKSTGSDRIGTPQEAPASWPKPTETGTDQETPFDRALWIFMIVVLVVVFASVGVAIFAS